MLRLPIGLGCALTLLLAGGRPLAAQDRDAPDTRPMTIAVTEFAGSDKEVGRFIAETLLTDLAVSDKLRVVEGADVRRAAVQSGLHPGQTLDPLNVRRLGGVVHADRILVGSYLIQDGQLVINARLLDTRTGRIVPGAAANVSGPRRDMLEVTNRLAKTLHRRIAGSELNIDDTQPVAAPPADNARPAPAADLPNRETRADADPAEAPKTEAPSNDVQDALARLARLGITPIQVRSTDAVSTRSLLTLTHKVAHLMGGHAMEFDPNTDGTRNATRIRALAALVKAAVPASEIADPKEVDDDQLPPDAKDIPAWGRAYVATAIKQGWWTVDERLRPMEPATWGFVGAVAGGMPLEGNPDTPAKDNGAITDPHADRDAPAHYTGLVIDARELDIDREPSPHVRDEDGNLLYPEETHVPDSEYVQDHGMVAYHESLDDAKRAGAHPMIVKALSTAGAGKDDFVISNEDADEIRGANHVDGFLSKWAVVILQAPRVQSGQN